MKLQVKMIIMSHLSDSQELNGMQGMTDRLHIHINFAKFLLMKYPNTEVEVDAVEEYKKFSEKFGLNGKSN